MLRRLLLGQPKRDEKDLNNDICQREERLINSNSKAKTAETSQGQKNNNDTSESDSETECSSETEDVSSDTESLSSRPDCSFDDCTEDILDWKGFEMLKNDQSRKGKKLKSAKDEDGDETTANQGNPFAYAFESEKGEMPQKYDKEKDGGHTNADNLLANKNTENKNDDLTNTNSVNIDTKRNNEKEDKLVMVNDNNKKSDNQLNEKNEREEKKDILNKRKKSKSENNNSNNNEDIKINIKSATKQNVPRQPEKKNDCNSEPTTSNDADITKNAMKSATSKQLKSITNDNNNNTQRSQMNSIPKTKNLRFDEKYLKSTTNQSIVKTNPTSITRDSNSSFCANQTKKSSKSYIQGKSPKVKQNQRSPPDRRGTTVDTRSCQGSKKGTGSTTEIFSDVSDTDLEKFLGVNMVELREVIKKFKLGKDKGTIGEYVEQSEVAQDNLGSPGDRTVINGSKNGKIQRSKNKEETVENKDEISSDSGVSEPDAHSTEKQLRYITFKAIVKRRRYLEGHIKKLEERLVAMKDHEKDIQFLHDLFDLYNDSLAKVERNNAGVANVTHLKSILARQLEEMDEKDFNEKLKALEDLGIPHFSEVNARVEKLRRRIQRSLGDNRKCRSKDVQKLRFDVGKVQGMCEAVLECVYQK